jgi:hypothetical protein
MTYREWVSGKILNIATIAFEIDTKVKYLYAGIYSTIVWRLKIPRK